MTIRAFRRVRQRPCGLAARWLLIGFGAAVAAYATYGGVAWLRYGHASASTDENRDPLLDRFMPIFDVAERHHIRVAAPAEVTFAAACAADLQQSPLARAIFYTRERLLGSEPDSEVRPRELLALTKSLGWAVLAEVPGREVVMGAVTRPWEANVIFRGLPPGEFIAFNEPGYVKIAWTLRADPDGHDRSIFHTETRVCTTDAESRARFRRYWSYVAPGVELIRIAMLRPLKTLAEKKMMARAA